jgi:hypothetical protein
MKYMSSTYQVHIVNNLHGVVYISVGRGREHSVFTKPAYERISSQILGRYFRFMNIFVHEVPQKREISVHKMRLYIYSHIL